MITCNSDDNNDGVTVAIVNAYINPEVVYKQILKSFQLDEK